MRLRIRTLLAVVSLAIAAAIWLPLVHLIFRPPVADLVADHGVAPLARKVANYHLDIWTTPALLERELAKMRSANAEWDFMGRSFFVWSLANMALRDPQLRPEALATMDLIIDHTLQIESTRGLYVFLMDYGRARPFVQKPARTQFVDGEIALMLGMRCVVADKAAYRELLAERVRIVVDRMEASPTLSAESYPDECWTFCNTIALAAIRVSDYLDGGDHSGLIRRWLAVAQARLLEPKTGLLISAYTLDGDMIHPPEGSSIWMVAHCLSLLDEPFAREQYRLARRELGGSFLGLGYARERPAAMDSGMDIDSGLIVPGLRASMASSGLAFIGAGAFGDVEFTRSLATSLGFLCFPIERQGRVRYAASNQVGDATLLYGLTLGPVWDKVRKTKP